HVGRPAVHLAVLTLDQLDGDLRLGLAVLVLDDRVRLAELGRELLVLGELLEQPADVLVDLVSVSEVSHGRKSMAAVAPATSEPPGRRGLARPTGRCR